MCDKPVVEFPEIDIALCRPATTYETSEVINSSEDFKKSSLHSLFILHSLLQKTYFLVSVVLDNRKI